MSITEEFEFGSSRCSFSNNIIASSSDFTRSSCNTDGNVGDNAMEDFMAERFSIRRETILEAGESALNIANAPSRWAFTIWNNNIASSSDFTRSSCKTDGSDDDSLDGNNNAMEDSMAERFFIRRATILEAGASVLNIFNASSRWALTIALVLELFLIARANSSALFALFGSSLEPSPGLVPTFIFHELGGNRCCSRTQQ